MHANTFFTLATCYFFTKNGSPLPYHTVLDNTNSFTIFQSNYHMPFYSSSPTACFKTALPLAKSTEHSHDQVSTAVQQQNLQNSLEKSFPSSEEGSKLKSGLFLTLSSNTACPSLLRRSHSSLLNSP